jgi:GxxExxY protein
MILTGRKLQVYNEVALKIFIADFICFDKIVVEIKATSFLHNKDTEAQTINYLKMYKIWFTC